MKLSTYNFYFFGNSQTQNGQVGARQGPLTQNKGQGLHFLLFTVLVLRHLKVPQIFFENAWNNDFVKKIIFFSSIRWNNRKVYRSQHCEQL